MTTKEKEIISKAELASIFAIALKAPVQERANILYGRLEEDYKFLKKKHPAQEDYNRAVEKFYTGLIAFHEKHIGSSDLIVEKFIADQIMVTSLAGLGGEGHAYFEHDKIRRLQNFYLQKLEPKYKYSYEPYDKLFGEVEVVAYVNEGEILKEISFEFQYLSNELEFAATLLATDKLIKRIREKLKKKNNPTDTGLKEKIQPEKGDKAIQKRFKLIWNGSQLDLLKIFRKMANEKHPKFGKLLNNVGDDQIEYLVRYNFDIPVEGFVGDRKGREPQKLQYCGDRSALIRFFYYLTLYKDKNNKPFIETDVNIKKALADFLQRSFLIGDKDCKNYAPLKESTITACLNDCKKFGNSAEEFHTKEYDEEGRLRHNSLIGFLIKILR